MVTIVPLTAERMGDWLVFFDKRAFVDHPSWKTCYCAENHKPNVYTAENGKRISNRNYAQWLIRADRMHGYLAYADDGTVIGWCNADEDRSFPAFVGKETAVVPNGVRNSPGADAHRVKSVACFVVDKKHRRRGVARALLERVVEDARGEGYAFVEAYPRVRARTDGGNYRGPIELYRQFGFEESTVAGRVRVRKSLIES